MDCPGVASLEHPTGNSSYRDAAVTARMSVQRDEIHLRLKRQTDRIEVVPFGVNRFIQKEFGLVGDVALDVGELEPMADLSTYKCLIFSSVHMDFCVRKIRQTTDMVKMHVGQDNVPDLF